MMSNKKAGAICRDLLSLKFISHQQYRGRVSMSSILPQPPLGQRKCENAKMQKCTFCIVSSSTYCYLPRLPHQCTVTSQDFACTFDSKYKTESLMDFPARKGLYQESWMLQCNKWRPTSGGHIAKAFWDLTCAPMLVYELHLHGSEQCSFSSKLLY